MRGRVSNFGNDSSKQPAVNIMIVATMWSLLIWWRSRYELPAGRSKIDVALVSLFLVSAANIVWLGVTGHYIPAKMGALDERAPGQATLVG